MPTGYGKKIQEAEKASKKTAKGKKPSHRAAAVAMEKHAKKKKKKKSKSSMGY